MNKQQRRKNRNELIELFDVKSVKKIPDKLMEICMNKEYEFFDRYLEAYPDLSIDSLSKLFQTFYADTDSLAQNFTPDDIAQLITELAMAGKEDLSPDVLDECAGIGTLAINYWNKNHDVIVYCREISEDTIPFLLFNLMVRNIQGVVVQGDTISLETQRVFLLDKGEKYSNIRESKYLARECTNYHKDPLEVMFQSYQGTNFLNLSVKECNDALEKLEALSNQKQGVA